MYDIKILEEEWKRYRRKKLRPWIIGGILLISLLVGLSTMLNDSKVDFSLLFSKTEKERQNIIANSEKILIDGPLVTLEHKNQPIMDENPLVEVSLESDKKENDVTSEPKKLLTIQVVDANNPKAYKEVEKRFRLGHDVDDSLFLAKSYYAKGQYKKAEYWALQTNKIDENIEEGWLIFVKSKLKRGQKNEALRILNSYIKRTHSAEAKALLEKIKKGRL